MPVGSCVRGREGPLPPVPTLPALCVARAVVLCLARLAALFSLSSWPACCLLCEQAAPHSRAAQNDFVVTLFVNNSLLLIVLVFIWQLFGRCAV